MSETSDRTLEILIKLGFIGEENADAAREALAGIKKETGDLSQSQMAGFENWEKYRAVLKDTSEEGMKVAGSGREMRLVAAQLNGILPGLGIAFRGIVGAMGPIAVVVLAIQAATTWWKFYKDAVDNAAKAHAEAMDKFRSTTAAAIDENHKWAQSMEDSKTAAQHLAAALAEGEAILEAQLKVKKELTGKDDEAGARQARINLLGDVMAATRAKENELVRERADLEKQLVEATKAKDAGRIKEITDELGNVRAQKDEVQAQYDELERRQRTAINVNAIETKGEHAAEIVKAGGPAPFVAGVASAETAFLHGQKLTASDTALLQAFGDYSRDHGLSNNQIMALLRSLAASDRARAGEIEFIQRQLANLPGRG